MFQLLQPIWLFAMSAIAIPLIIHLWSTRKGKTLQVGSILLLRENVIKQSRNLRFKDILLLILRCLLIITLAFLLAKPTWRKQLNATDEKGWIMIEEQSLSEAYKNFKPTIDSLIKSGYKFHYFNKGFMQDNFEDALKAKVDTSAQVENSYWALLKQLNEQVPAELPIYLFTDNKLRRFTGERPQVNMNLKWLIYTAGDTLLRSIVKAYKTATDSIRVVVSNSTPSGIFYTSENIGDNSTYKVDDNNGRITVSSTDTLINNNAEVDTSSLDIAIYTDQFFTDANYVKAAIDAIQQYTGLKIKASFINNISSIKPGMDWLFWLSEKALPLQNLPPKIFIYEKGKEQQINSWVRAVNNFSLNEEAVHLSRFIQNNSPAGDFENVWKDGFGHPLLALEKANNYTYHFYSRLNPAWNDLPWSTQFAEMIFDLLIQPESKINNFDNRIIDADQLQPEVVKNSKTFNKQNFVETTDLTKLFWLIAFILFCIERYISLTGNKREAYA